MLLSRFPRISLGHFPTRLEPMPNLTRHLGGPQLFIKRDDCTGLATGGNKTRKLEYLMAEALAQKADIVITQGAVQSNHARQTAAAAAKLSMRCDILLEERVQHATEEYNESGNVLLDRLLGGNIVSRLPLGTDMQAAMEAHAATLTAAGQRPYIIPGGGSNPVGALGYVGCALELINQAAESGVRIDRVVHATGSTGTQAGLVAGLWGMNTGIPVLGISVRAPRAAQEANVAKLARATLKVLGVEANLPDAAVVANSDYVGEGYGLPTPEAIEAIEMLARLEGILLDPVYSAKGMAGLIDLIRKGQFEPTENIVFVHTGGSAGLFGYRDRFVA